jgi:hypothetical protein
MEIKDQSIGEGQKASAERSFGGPPPQAAERSGPIASIPRDSIELQRRATADRIGVLATAAEHAADDLKHQFPRVAGYMHSGAAGLEHISDILRDPKLDEFASLIGDMARRQPAALLAGIVILSFGVATYLNGSSEMRGDEASRSLASNR